MFWLRNKKNNFHLRTLICGPVIMMFVAHNDDAELPMLMLRTVQGEKINKLVVRRLNIKHRKNWLCSSECR